MNLPVTPATNYRMTNATGPSFQIRGKTSFILRRKKHLAKIDALVVEGNHPLLISWKDCVLLKLITRKFPLDDDDDSKSTSSDSNMVNISQISTFKKSSHFLSSFLAAELKSHIEELSVVYNFLKCSKSAPGTARKPRTPPL